MGSKQQGRFCDSVDRKDWGRKREHSLVTPRWFHQLHGMGTTYWLNPPFRVGTPAFLSYPSPRGGLPGKQLHFLGIENTYISITSNNRLLSLSIFKLSHAFELFLRKIKRDTESVWTMCYLFKLYSQQGW